MAEAFDTRELAAALDGDAGAELTITDLPNDVLVSIFEAVGDLRYVSHTAPCVKKLEEIKVGFSLSSLPKELVELSGLTKLDVSYNNYLGDVPQDEAFPAELGKMKSLRVLSLASCNLRIVPAFVGELESLEALDLSWNNFQIDAPLDFLIKCCPRLREVALRRWPYEGPRTPESLVHLGAFKAKLLAGNPNAKVVYE